MSILYKLRKKLGLSQVDLEAGICVNQSTISKIEAGHRVITIMQAKKLIVYAREKGITITLEDVYDD